MNRLFKRFLLLAVTVQTSAPAMAQKLTPGAPVYSMTQLLAFPLFLLALWVFIRIMKARSKDHNSGTFSRAANRARARAGKKHASTR